MWEIQPERLRAAMGRAAANQSQLADAVGLKQPSIGRLLSGETKTSRALNAIAAYLRTTPQYLVGETDDPSTNAAALPAHSPPTAVDDYDPDLVNIHEIDLSMGMGLSYLDVPITRTVRTFDRNWLRHYTHTNPDRIFFCEGIGNSMEPYIHSRDLLLIDSSEPSIRMSDQIWACAYGNCGTVKRLRPMPDGSVKMIAENPSVPDEVAYDGELHLIGRVVAIVRKI